MAKCNCGAQTCGCKLVAGDNVAVSGSGTVRDPWVVSASASGEGGGGFSSGDRKETYRQDTEAGWLECLGGAFSRTTYATLFAQIGTRFGEGDGVNTFNVPNEAGRVPMGAGPGFDQDATGGNASTTLVAANLPPHVHTITHVHSIAHDHANFLTDADEGRHNHNGDLKIATAQLPNHTHNAPNAGGQTSAAGGANNNNAVSRGDSAGADTTAPLAWVTGGDHRHNINVPPFAGNSGASSAPNSGSVGNGQAFSNLPPYRAVRVLIKT